MRDEILVTVVIDVILTVYDILYIAVIQTVEETKF